MTITIHVLNQVSNLAVASPPIPASISVSFAIQNDAIIATWYRWSRGLSADTADVQAALNAEGTALYNDAVTGNVTMTQNQVDTQTYLWLHYANRNDFAFCFYTMENTLLNAPDLTVVGNYRTALTTILLAMQNANFPAVFANHFTQERIARGINGAINTFTIAQCQAMDALIHEWLTARNVSALYSATVAKLGD